MCAAEWSGEGAVKDQQHILFTAEIRKFERLSGIIG